MLMLLDRDESFIASLKYKDIKRKREINGLNTLEFGTNKEVEFGQRLIFKDRQGLWHEYIIIDYFESHNENGLTYEVYCEDNTIELYGHYIDDLKPRNEKASSIFGKILEGTRFEPGYVDDFGTRSFNLYRTNCKAALWKLLEEYGAEIQVRLDVDKYGIRHRYIDLKKSIGRYAGKRFTYKKDVGSIKKTTSIKELVTALYGYGKGEEIVGEDGQPSGGYGRKIDFAEINDGKKYVEDEEARKKYGTGPERKHIFGIADFQDCEDKRELLELTKAKLKELSKPKITYELKVEDLSSYEGYEGEGVGLGDTVLVIDKEKNTRVQTRVVSIVDNPLEEIEDSEIILGNFIKDLSENYVEYDKLKSAFENNRNVFNNELEKLANGVKSSYIQRVLEKFNKELNETGGWVYAEEGEGLLILNAPKEGNPTQAINLKGGKIAIANHKNADGSFAYETFGDGDGFTANLIRAGVLRGGKVFFNLEDGTFLIGESRTNYSMYWDGGTLHLRNVDIDLENNRTIKNMIGDINENKVQQDNKNKTLDQQILDLKSSVKITDGRISTSVESLTKDINSRDKDIRTYITNNYSTKTQTDQLIESKVSSINTRLGSAESRISQTATEISKTVKKDGVISAINQSAESVKIKASKIDLQGDVSLTGVFTTKNKGGYTNINMEDSRITFYRNSNGKYGSTERVGYISGDTITVRQYKGGDPNDNNNYEKYDFSGPLISHEYGKGIIFGDSIPTYGWNNMLRSNFEKDLYCRFRFGTSNDQEYYPIRFYQRAYFEKEICVWGKLRAKQFDIGYLYKFGAPDSHSCYIYTPHLDKYVKFDFFEEQIVWKKGKPANIR